VAIGEGGSSARSSEMPTIGWGLVLQGGTLALMVAGWHEGDVWKICQWHRSSAGTRREPFFKWGRDECCVARGEGRLCRVTVVGVHWAQASRVKWRVVVSYLAGEGELTVGDRCSLGGVRKS